VDARYRCGNYRLPAGNVFEREEDQNVSEKSASSDR